MGATMNRWPYCTTAWRKLRAAKLDQHALCVICLRRGKTVLANTVDHIKPISQGGDPFPPLDQLQSLCASCHSEKTHMHDKTKGNALGRRFKGCDETGQPIDPNDGWWR